MVNILFTFILSFVLFSISKEDIKTMLISENKLRLLAILGIFYLIILSYTNREINSMALIINNIFAMLIIFITMYSLSHLSYKILRVNSLGLGDIKLSSISALWLGIEMSFTALYISFMISAIYCLNGKITKRFKRFHQYPFAPFISIGIICSWILDKI